MQESIHLGKITSHITLSSCEEIASLMLPKIEPHGIKVFNYYRIYFDGGIIRLSTDRAWSFHYFKKNYIKLISIAPSYLTQRINYYLWLIEDCPLMLQDAAINFNTANGITIAKVQANFIEYFCFGSTVQNTRIVNNFYLNNIEVLDGYGELFKEHAVNIISIHAKNKFYLPDNAHCNLHLKDKFPIIKLSKVQHNCAQLLLKGLKYKEIASKLNLSPRTIETHINALKRKLHSRDKANLIIKLADVL